MRALERLERSKRITTDQRRQYALAAYSVIPIPGAGNDCLINRLHGECEKIAKASGDFLDTLADWWSRIVAWIVDNWPTIMQLMMTFIAFI